MKKIIKHLNDNVIILALTTLIQLIFRKKDQNYNKKSEKIQEARRTFENKAELLITKDVEDDENISRINLFMTDFRVSISKREDKVKFYYSKDVCNKEKYRHFIFYLKNIGNADINQLDICVSCQKSIMLCDIEDLNDIVNNNVVNYNHCFDRKILKTKSIILDIAYLENSNITNYLSSELVLLFKDSYNNSYQQSFFLASKNLYEPNEISDKEYRIYTTIDTALECFKKNWMW